MMIPRLPTPRLISIGLMLLQAFLLAACGDGRDSSGEEQRAGLAVASDIRAAMFSGVSSGSVVEDDDPDGDNLLEVSGRLAVTGGSGEFIAGTKKGKYGALVIDAAGSWSYEAVNSRAIIQVLSGGATLTDAFVVSSTDGFVTTVEITIIGQDEVSPGLQNTPAIISGNTSGSVLQNASATLAVTGKLNVFDPDAGEATFAESYVSGKYGFFGLNSSGYWYYIANNNLGSIQALGSNQALTESFSVSTIDGTTTSVDITISGEDTALTGGRNHAAVISGMDRGVLREDNDSYFANALVTAGKLDIVDNDPGEAAFVATTIAGDYGWLQINAEGYWRYVTANALSVIQSLADGATLLDALVVSSVDGTTHTIDISIQGVNDEAVIGGQDTGAVIEDDDRYLAGVLVATGKLTVTDRDQDESAFVRDWYDGDYGRVIISPVGDWYYLVENALPVVQNLKGGEYLTDRVNIASIDGTTHTVAISIIGRNEVMPTASVTLSWVAPAAREDNSPLSLSEIAGYRIYYGVAPGQYDNSVDTGDGSTEGYTLTGLAPGKTYYLVVTSYDTSGRESAYSSEVSVTR